MTKQPIQVLLFEDNPGDARLFREYLHEDDLVQFGLDHVERLRTGLEHLTQGMPDVILLDLGLPDSQGLETFTQVYAQAQAVPIVVLTGLDDAKQAVEAVRAGAQDYLVKGEVSGGLLMRAIRYAIERKDAARTLRESEERYRLLVETLPDGVVVHSRGRVVFANPASAKIIGAASPADLTGKPVMGFVHPDYREPALKRIQQSLGGGGPAPLAEEKFVRLDGTPIDVEVSAIPFSYAGEPSMLTVFNNVTGRKQGEQELLKLRKAVETSGEVIFMTDREGVITFLNPEFTRLYGHTAEEVVGKTTPRILKGGLIESEHYEQLWHSLLNTQVVRGEFVNKTKDGRLLTIEGSINPILDEGQEVVGFLAIQRDITERKQAEEEIRRRLSQLEVLYASSLTIGQLLQPQQIGQKVMELLSEKLDWQFASIHLWHRESESLEPLVFHQPGWESEVERRAAEERLKTRVLQPGQGLVDWVIQHGLTVYCGDVTNDSRYVEAWPGMNSGMYVPMKVGESTIGCLRVESERVNAFSETDEWLLTTLAAQAASVLENARLLEQTARGLKRVQALHTIDTAISSSLDLRLTIDVFLDEVVRQLGVDAADVLRFNPHTQTLEYLAGHGFRTDALQHTRLRLGEGYAGTAGLERRIIHIPDLQNRNTDALRSPYFSSEGFEACFCVPLIAKGQLKGVLEIFHRSSLDNAGEEWQEFLETLAGQAAIAIDNISLFEELTRSNIGLSLAYDSTIEGWSRALDLRDKETEGHTLRVTEITVQLAQAAGVSEAELVHIRRGALLHDIGKMGVPDGILLKPGPLTDEEWGVMRKHPQLAYDMLSPIAYLKPALDIPYCHHEKWDGTGYPRGLKGEQIPLAARLFAVVDVWDALRSDRPYRKAWPEEKVLAHIKAGSGAHFDPQAVELFLMMSEEAHQHGQAAG